MQLGGTKLAIQTVDALVGKALPINHVVIVDFNQFEKLIDAVGGITVNVPENILSNRFDCPYPTRAALLAVAGLALPQGPDAPERAPGAHLLPRPREPARPLVDGLRPPARPAARRAGDAEQAVEPVALLLAPVQRQLAAQADRDRPLDVEAHAALVGEVPGRPHDPLPARRHVARTSAAATTSSATSRTSR